MQKDLQPSMRGACEVLLQKLDLITMQRIP